MGTFHKAIKGNDNEQVESLSHNRITIEGGSSALILVIFICVLATAAIIMMTIIHLELVEALVAGTFVGLFFCFWTVIFAFTLRQVHDTATAIAVNTSLRTRASAEASVAHATDHYILWREPDGSFQFRGTVHVEEHRQFLPKEIAPPNQAEGILALYDTGMSGRSIEKHMNSVAKDAGTPKVTYREIQRVLNLYRPDWTKKPEVKSDIVDAD